MIHNLPHSFRVLAYYKMCSKQQFTVSMKMKNEIKMCTAYHNLLSNIYCAALAITSINRVSPVKSESGREFFFGLVK